MAGLLRQVTVVVLAALQVWVPAVVLSWPGRAWADYRDAARRGQALGRTLVPGNPQGLITDNQDGTFQLNLPQGAVTVRPQDLFPDMANTSDPNAASLVGSDAGIHNRTQTQLQELAGSGSYTGQAYRTLQGSANRARVNMSQDPIWAQTDAAIQQAVSGAMGECHTEVVGNSGGGSTAHVPDYRTCERIVRPVSGVCRLRHDYEVRVLATIGTGYSVWVRDKAWIKINLLAPEIVDTWGSEYYGAELLSAEPVDYNLVCGALSEGVRRIKAEAPENYYNRFLDAPECTGPEGMVVTALSCQHSNCGPPGSGDTYRHNIYGMSWKVVQLIDRGWSADPGCEVLLSNPDGDAFIRPVSFECTQGPCEESGTVGGVVLEQADFYVPNPLASRGISSLAREVTVTLDAQAFNVGRMDCWTDPQGQAHCPDNTGERQDTCGELENNPACSFVRQECIEGARDPGSGVCYAYTAVFDCGHDVQVNQPQSRLALVCDGQIRCLGTECVDGHFDPGSGDFARAASLLQAAQYMRTDLDCSQTYAAGCVVFSGQHYTCKKALGGWVDCCQEPEGVSLVDYVLLTFSSYRLLSANWDLVGVLPDWIASNPLNGAWSYLRSGYDYLSNAITSAWDNLVGKVGEEAAANLYSSSLTQTLMHNAYDIVHSISPNMADMIFEFNPLTGELELTTMMQNIVGALQFCMWIYTIYSILDILVHIIWACEQSEFELGAKRQLKVCHYVGSYCASRAVGVCIEKRDSYCCFNSPLSRILQEQIRMQTGHSWGGAESPDCSGLHPAELAQVNWDQVDLSEWLALLTMAGVAPQQRTYTLDGLTGSGSPWNFADTADPRPDAAARTQDRLGYTGQDLEQLRINRGLELWGQH